jgi:hypothetical protein
MPTKRYFYSDKLGLSLYCNINTSGIKNSYKISFYELIIYVHIYVLQSLSFQ